MARDSKAKLSWTNVLVHDLVLWRMEAYRRGIRIAFGLFRSNPGVACSAVAVLGAGIGFTTTMFSIVHGATRALPFDQPAELVILQKTVVRGATLDVPAVEYQAWVSGARSFEALGAFAGLNVNLAGDGREPERASGAALTPNTFALLGQVPLLGRALQQADTRPGAEPVVVLGHTIWQRRFNADPQLVGKTIRLTGTAHTVVGVMPPRFGFPVSAAFWVPLRLDAAAAPGAGPYVRVFGRLADGVSLESAGTELDTITRQREGPSCRGDTCGAAVGRVIQMLPLHEMETPREIVRALYLLVVAVFFVLLIACSNVANLLLARAAVRARDVAIRMALGAGRRAVLLEHAAEMVTVAIIASVAGLGLAHAGTRVFAVNTSHIVEAFWVDFRVDMAVVLFASLLATLAAVGAGLGPALKVSRTDAGEVLKDRGHGGSSLRLGRLSRGLIAFQVALACGLLALTIVLARSSLTMRAALWPFAPREVLTLELGVTEAMMSDVARRNRFLTDLSNGLDQIPGAEATGLTTVLPGRGSSWTFALDRPAPPDSPFETTAVAFVTPGFFQVTAAAVRAGRLLTWQDDAGAPAAAVVNESFVRRFSADRDPLGRLLFLGTRFFTIVGVVPDLMAHDVQERRQDGVYASILQFRPFAVRVMARGAGDPLALTPGVRDMIRRLDPDLPIQEIFTLEEAVYRDKRVLDVLSSLFMVFGIGALLLTAIGLYGVVSFVVAQRTREIGIRRALGASSRQVLSLVVGQGSRQLLIGLVVGLLLAVAFSHGFAAAVDQEALAAPDAALLAGIAGSLGLTALLALVMPARRALRIEIVKALRVE